MTPIDRLALEQHSGPYENWPTRSRLIDAGVITATHVPGYNLLHQFELKAGSLLVTDYDCPFEEATTFILLAPDLHVLDTHTFGAPYASFLLDRIEVIDDSSLRVVFYDEDAWRVSVHKPALRFMRPRLRAERWPKPARPA